MFGVPMIVSSRTAFINVLNCGINLGRELRMIDSVLPCIYANVEVTCQRKSNRVMPIAEQYLYLPK